MMDSVINDTLDNVLCKEAWLPHYLVNDILLFQVNTAHGYWLHSFAIFKLEIEFRNKFCPVKNVKSVGLVFLSYHQLFACTTPENFEQNNQYLASVLKKSSAPWNAERKR